MSTATISAWLATGLGLGYAPGLPGTAGALGGVLVAIGLAHTRLAARLIAIVALLGLAVPVCGHGARVFGSDDPRIVADELLSFPVATAALPVSRHPGLLAGVFVTSRVLDGLKPPPARAAEQVHGGLGIVLDDVVANAWTLILGVLAWRWWRRRGPSRSQ